jgi:hypothetical protein
VVDCITLEGIDPNNNSRCTYTIIPKPQITKIYPQNCEGLYRVNIATISQEAFVYCQTAPDALAILKELETLLKAEGSGVYRYSTLILDADMMEAITQGAGEGGGGHNVFVLLGKAWYGAMDLVKKCFDISFASTPRGLEFDFSISPWLLIILFTVITTLLLWGLVGG